MLHHDERAPPPALAPMVEAMWTLVHAGDGMAAVPVLPDGAMDLIFAGRLDPDGRGLAGGRLLISGTDRRVRRVEVASGSCFVGLRFRAGWARGALGVDPLDLVDAGTAAAADVSARLGAIEARLGDCRTPADLGARLSAECGELLGRAKAPPLRVRRAIGLLRGNPSIAALARALGVNERTLHRDLSAWTGLGAKRLGRIFRLHGALDRIRGGTGELAAIALDAGYADQAHMTREFRALCGATPTDFRG